MPSEKEADDVIEALVREHGQQLRLWLFKRFPGLDDLAGDAMNDALLTIWIRLSNGRMTSCTRAYLFTAARLAALDRLRALGRIRQHEHQEPLAEENHGSGHDPMSEVELIEDLNAAVRRLPDRQQKVIMLRAAGYSVQETAKAVGMSSNTVGPTVTRAKSTLRRLMEGETTDDR